MTNKKIIKTRYAELVNLINEHNFLYHTYDSPKITDSEYDKLYKELKNIENNNPEIITENSPTQRVGSNLLEGFEKKSHDTPMLSLSNAATEKEFTEFYTKAVASTNLKNIELFAEPKFDGLAVSITYINKKYSSAITRGDGFIGEDVTQNVKTIKTLPLILHNKKLPNKFTLRGEIFIDKKDFNIINKQLEDINEKKYSNPRNLAAGSIRQLDPNIANSRNLKLFIHGVSNYDQFTTFTKHDELITFISSLDFPTNKYSKVIRNLNNCFKYFKDMNTTRDSIPYEIDGLVYRLNNLSLHRKLGSTSKAPKWAIAYKFKSLEALSIVEGVTFQVGRTGTITPVAELKPVNIGGVLVSRATLHNFSEINSKDIRISDFVYVKRAGDVIPDIDRVDLNKRKTTIKIIPPKKCPSCNSVLKKIKNQVAFKCLNHKKCTPQIEQSIIHFISRKGMNIIGMGDQIIRELVSKNIIKRSADIYTLSKSDFEELDRVGDKSIENYLNAIKKSKKISFNKFIYALGIKEVGQASSNSIASFFNTIGDFINCNIDSLVQIDDIGPVVAQNIIQFFTDSDNKKNISDLISSGIQISYSPVQETHETIVITGTFQNFPRNDLIDELAQLGYKITNTVSKKTNILICGDKPGSKHQKANNLGIKILYEEDLVKLLSEAH